MTPEKKLKLYEELFGTLESREWSGERFGQGSGPMGSGSDGCSYSCCPICRGLQKPNGEFVADAVGHQPGCRLAAALGQPTRPLQRGEQGSMAL